MLRRPRCRSCARLIWPWQASGGWAAAGVKDNHALAAMRHMECIRFDNGLRRAEHNARVESLIRKSAAAPICPVCGGPVNGVGQCCAEIWSGRLRH